MTTQQQKTESFVYSIVPETVVSTIQFVWGGSSWIAGAKQKPPQPATSNVK